MTWNIEQEKDREEEEKVGERPVNLIKKKGDRDLEPEKNKGDFFVRRTS